jgi:hypothetical protein
MATQAVHPSPHPPVATLGSLAASFQKNPRICGKAGGLKKKVSDLRQTGMSRVCGGPWWICGKLAGGELGGGGNGVFSLYPQIS